MHPVASIYLCLSSFQLDSRRQSPADGESQYIVNHWSQPNIPVGVRACSLPLSTVCCTATHGMYVKSLPPLTCTDLEVHASPVSIVFMSLSMKVPVTSISACSLDPKCPAAPAWPPSGFLDQLLLTNTEQQGTPSSHPGISTTWSFVVALLTGLPAADPCSSRMPMGIFCCLVAASDHPLEDLCVGHQSEHTSIHY